MTTEHEKHEKELNDAIDHLHPIFMQSGNPLVHQYWWKLVHAAKDTEKDYKKLEEKEDE